MITFSMTTFGIWYSVIKFLIVVGALLIVFGNDNSDRAKIKMDETTWELIVGATAMLVFVFIGLTAANYTNYTDLSAREYNIEQMITDVKQEGYEVKEKTTCLSTPYLRVKTIRSNGKKKYIYYIPETDAYKNYER